MKRIHAHLRNLPPAPIGWLLLCLFCLAAPLVNAAAPKLSEGRLLILLSTDAPRYHKMEQRFRAGLAEQCRGAMSCPEIRTALAEAPQPDGQRLSLIVAVGHKASDIALRRHPRIPQLHVMVSRNHFLQRASGTTASAIYLEQPPERLIAFSRFLLPKRQRIGILLGPNSPWTHDALRAAAREAEAEPRIAMVHKAKDIGLRLRQLRTRIDLLLALPDPLVYNRSTLATILLASFRNRIPVIGFSHGMAKAGAVAALFSSPESMGAEAAERAWQLLNGAPASRGFPRRFETAVNRRVARALRLTLPSDTEIERWARQP